MIIPMYGIIFDMDGVLVDSARPHYESWRRMAREIGRDMSEEDFRRTFGRQNRDIIPMVLGIDDPDEVQRLGDRKEEIYRQLIAESVPAVDGAADLVRSLHAAGFRLAIGSSGPPENVEAVLQGMGITELFSARATSREVSRGKPDPQVFTVAADMLGLEPRACAVVEDAPAGIEAALAAGAVAVALAGQHPVDKLGRAHWVVESLRDLTPERFRGLIENR